MGSCDRFGYRRWFRLSVRNDIQEGSLFRSDWWTWNFDGAIQGLLLAQYETLRENGHEPSEAFNETVEELTQSLMPLFAENGMDWMYANCSTTAQRGALDWMGPFHDAVKPVFEKLYREVACGNEAQRSIDTNSKPDYREGLEKELAALRESEMWRAGAVVRKLRPENNW